MLLIFFFSSRRRHTSSLRDWSTDVCSSDLLEQQVWRIADEAAFDHCWAFDHLVTVGSGGQPNLLFEGWSLVCAMSVATTKSEERRVGKECRSRWTPSQ